ncbi:zona pellucida sperm-binding protein 3-like isoform X2 [Hippocampus comes]|uniref:zona pellucida sperm-binding protein 3-like isoform X2 n=1 Tax=Hippocampus comes TaxID=109280 RepID=UPI00094E8FCF|nr:PREDICTED: zona pellucida sperm-binding protein 3-like isoform X2 [Hippocampus comes]
MGLWGVLFGFFLSGASLCTALNSFNTTSTPNARVWTWTPLPTQPKSTDHQSNRTEPSKREPFPASRRLWIHQLKRPAVEERAKILQTQQASEPQPSFQDHVVKTLIQGPDLEPPTEVDPKMVVDLREWFPVPADSLAVQCGEGEVIIEVKRNFLGNGQLIHPSDLTLGGCSLLDIADDMLRFQTELHGCGSTKKMTEEALVYTFLLTYVPTPVGSTSIFKTNPSEVLIECHYPRRHQVSSDSIASHWQEFASSLLTEQQLHFSLRLMTEEWQLQRSTGVYFVGEMMQIEASAPQGHHVPLRVYVDSCVATMSASPNSQPAYVFVDNHGCLIDAKLTGAKSYFMQRSSENKLAFQLKAFTFHQDDKNWLYITCLLKATTVSAPVNSQHKACSFLAEAKRWVASGGDNKVCSCCESSCSEKRRKRDLGEDAAAGLLHHVQWEGTAHLGRIQVEADNVTQPETCSSLQMPEVARAASSRSLATLCTVGTVLAGLLLAVIGAAICSRAHKPTVKVCI